MTLSTTEDTGDTEAKPVLNEVWASCPPCPPWWRGFDGDFATRFWSCGHGDRLSDQVRLRDCDRARRFRKIADRRRAPHRRAERSRRRRNEAAVPRRLRQDRKSTRLNSSHLVISYAVFCLKKKNKKQ